MKLAPLFSILTLLFLVTVARADVATTQPIHNTGKIFMWKVTGGKQDLYLLGSVHAGRPDFYPLPAEINQAYKAADVLAVEADIEKINLIEVQAMFMKQGMYPLGDSVANHLSRETYRALTDYLQARGMAPATFNQFRPWAIYITLTMLEIQQLGFDVNLGIDRYFLMRAHGKQKKTVAELESADFQLELLSGFDPKLQEQILAATLKDMDEMSEMMNTMIDAWLAGDADAIEKTAIDKTVDDAPELQPLIDKLFFERNATMTEKIDGYLKEDKKYFVVVGAGHLVGEKGIVNLLKQKGYTVEQVARKPATQPATQPINRITVEAPALSR